MTADHEIASERQPLLANNHDLSNTDSTSKLLPLAALPLQEDQAQDEDQDQGDEARRLAYFQSLPWYKRPSIAWLLPFIFLIAIVMGLSQVPQEQLIIKIICKEYFKDKGFPSLPSNSSSLLPLNGGNDDPCKAAPIQALAAVVLGRYRSLKSVTGKGGAHRAHRRSVQTFCGTHCAFSHFSRRFYFAALSGRHFHPRLHHLTLG